MAMQQEPKREVLTIHKAYFLGPFQGISPENMAKLIINQQRWITASAYLYPLVNVYIPMENHNL